MQVLENKVAESDSLCELLLAACKVQKQEDAQSKPVNQTRKTRKWSRYDKVS